MRVVLANTFDRSGGASRAAHRLLTGLRRIGVPATMCVQHVNGDEEGVCATSGHRYATALVGLRKIVDLQPIYSLYPERHRVPFSLNWIPGSGARQISSMAPDIVNLHWINAGYLSLGSLSRFQVPIVWTLHDMWPFTGGCHFSSGCDGYKRSCGRCPVLQSRRQKDVSRWNWRRKARHWRSLRPWLVAPSQWMADRAAESRLFGHLPITVIPNGLDTDRYRPQDRRAARWSLGLPVDAKIVLFCCNEALSLSRKGFARLVEAWGCLARGRNTGRWCLVVVGLSHAPPGYDIPPDTRFLGHLKDDVSLALAYSASDVHAVCSVEDNLPNTVMEAMACGTPCVAFRCGGIPEMVDHLENGFLAESNDIEGFVDGLSWLVAEGVRYRRIAENARKKSQTSFDHRIQATRYRELFQFLLDESTGRGVDRTKIGRGETVG